MKCMSMRKYAYATIVGGLALIPSIAGAATIHSNEITDANPSAANPFTSGQTVAANTTATGIGRGPGITANSGSNRYNATSFASTLDLNDYFYWTLTPNSGYQIDFTNLTGNWQRSSTGPNGYALRSSLDNYGANIASGAITGSGNAVSFNLDLSASAFNSVTSAITFRLYAFGGGGTFSVNDFVFDGAVSALALGNNTTITAPASANFGRVMVGQTPSQNINLSKTGSDTTTYTAVVNNNGLGVTADGAILGGAQSETVGLQLQNNSNGSGTTGSKTYTLTVDNTASNSAAAGQGSADPNDIVNVTATVVGNRTITASAVNLGNVIVGASTGTQTTTLSTTGDDNNNTRLSLGAGPGTDGSVTVAAGSSVVFNDAADSASRDVSGSFASTGPKSGSVALSVTGEGLAGEVVNSLAVSYEAVAFDPSTALFASNDSTELTIDFGILWEMNGVFSLSDAIYNALQTAGYTAELDFDVVSGTGDTSILYTDLQNAEFTSLSAGVANAYSFSAYFDTDNAPGVYSATYTLALSDANGYAGAGAAGSQLLTLNLTGAIVPEPSTFALAGASLIGLAALSDRHCRR
jgi:hypothetical protein